MQNETHCFPRLYFAFVLLLLMCRLASACFWDYDTIHDEKRGLPGIAEILSGRFEKHSKFFYEQRVGQMLVLLNAEPKNLDAWDNLAVAYEKLDDHAKAVETILKKDAIAPGQYTTYANLGTVYLHKGDFENGIAAIGKALEINPDAHFGREEYQLKLAQYYFDARKNPELLKQMNFLEHAGVLPPLPASSPTTEPITTAPDVAETNRARQMWGMDIEFRTHGGSPAKWKELGLKDNVFDGIVGIIRFGNSNSAELYLTLGDLLTASGNKNLAYRSYKRSLDFKHPRAEYLQEMMTALRSSIVHADGVSDEAIAKERSDAAAWVQDYQDFEDNLLRQGIDTNDPKNYQPFYARYGPPVVAMTLREQITDWTDHHGQELAIGLVLFAVISILPIRDFLRWRKARRRRVVA